MYIYVLVSFLLWNSKLMIKFYSLFIFNIFHIIFWIAVCSNSATLSNCPSPVTIGDRATVSCTSSTSNPASSIDWFVNGGKKDTGHTPAFTDGDYGGQRTTLKYTTKKLTKRDHGSQIMCRVTHPSMNCSLQPESTPCFLNIECKY